MWTYCKANQGENKEETTIPMTRGGIKGSRFAHLEVDDENEEMDVEGSHEAGNKGLETEMEPRSTESVNGKDKKVKCAINVEDEVNIVVSHASLAEGLKTRPGPDLGMTNGVKSFS